LVSNGLLKAILYGFLLWMPLYLMREHMSMYASTIPIVFNLGTLVGSFILGSLYEELETGEEPSAWNSLKANLKKYNLAYSCIIVSVCMGIFAIIRVNMALYFLLSVISGFFLGGTFNMLVGNEVIRIVGNNRRNVNYLSTLSMMTNNLATGLSEVIIGAALNHQHGLYERLLFVILTGVGVVSILTLFVRTRFYQK
jgi:hypothetical protein